LTTLEWVAASSSKTVLHYVILSKFLFRSKVDFEPTTTSNQASSSKRKTRQQREAETTLQLLEPEMPSEAALRREQEALELVVAAKETLTQEQVISCFIYSLWEFLNQIDKTK